MQNDSLMKSRNNKTMSAIALMLLAGIVSSFAMPAPPIAVPVPADSSAVTSSGADDKQEFMRLYVGRIELPYALKLYSMNPYLGEDSKFVPGTVSYDGIIYSNVMLRYDELKNQLVVLTPVKNICVIPDYRQIDWFEINGIRYIHDGEDASKFSQLLYEGNGIQLQKHSYKALDGEMIFDNKSLKRVEKKLHYVLVLPDGSTSRVKNASSFTKLFPTQKKAIKSLVKQQHLSFSEETRANDLAIVAKSIPQQALQAFKTNTETTSTPTFLTDLRQSSQPTIVTGIPAVDVPAFESKAREGEYVESKAYVVPGVEKAKQSISDDHELAEIVVVAGRQSAVKSATMGSEKFKPQLLKNIPSALGEVDIMKIVLALPGVKTVGEASSGYNVRGGATDQNLILFNGGTVYNPSHLFGLFTSFNSDMVEDVELFKSSIPSQYGGRISSVLNVTSKEASMKQFSGSVSIGALTSKLNLEVPIVKNHLSLLVNGRTTYSDWMLKLLPKKSGYKDGTANFYDLGGVLTWKLNDYHRLKIYAYFSNDRFSFTSDNKYGYTNRNLSAEWRSILGEHLTMIISGGQDHYDYYNDENMEIPSMSARLSFAINQLWGKLHFRHRPAEGHTMTYGLSAQHYDVMPGRYAPMGALSTIQFDELQKDRAMESAVYIDDEWHMNERMTVSGGLRLSMFNVLGPRMVNIYPADQLPTDANRIESSEMTGITKSYFYPEIRLSARYALTDNLSIKGGFNTMSQNIHKVSNTSVMSPTDIWKLSDNNIKPQKGWQLATGLYGQTDDKKYEASIEGYYKRISDYLNYRNSAILLMNHALETDVIPTKGYATGVELQVKKPNGRLNGWISYCYSRTFIRQDDKRVALPVNDGEWFPTEYDRPHELKAVLNYKFTERYSFSGNFDYSTGRPTTVPAGKYYDRSTQSYQPYYTKRNGYRLPDYMRCDAAFNIEPTHKLTALLHTSFSIGVYNVFARKNAYSIYYTVEDGEIKGYKLSVFGTAIPYVALNIRF